MKFFKSKSMLYASIATFFSFLVLFFTYLSARETKKESDLAQENIKSSVEDVSEGLKESLGKTSKIIDDINNLGDSLSVVKDDLKNSLSEAKRFQKLVDEQNKRDKERFESESANITSVSDFVTFIPSHKDPTIFDFNHKMYNSGKRNGVLKEYKLLLLLTDKELKIKQELNKWINEVNKSISPSDYNIISILTNIKEEDFKTFADNIVYIITYTYQDEILKKNIKKTFYYKWLGYDISGYKFAELNGNEVDEFKVYFNKKFGLE